MKKQLLIVLFSLLSCSPGEPTLRELELFLTDHWVEALSIEATYPEAFYPGKSIIKPQMTWKNLLKVKLKDSVHCLFYRIPHKRLSKGEGILKVTKLGKSEDCSRVLEKKEMFKIEGIKHLKLYFTSTVEKNLILKTKFKPFYLYLSASKTNQGELLIELPLFNILKEETVNPNRLGSKDFQFKKYDEPWKRTMHKGMQVFMGEIDLGEPSKRKQGNYKEGEVDYCYKVNSECKPVIEFECSRCEQGWYSVVDYNCKGGGSKLCGTSDCGSRGQPACPRGSRYSDLGSNLNCFKGSNAGICNKGLETYCDENKILVCR
jgi:hypothetical protein